MQAIKDRLDCKVAVLLCAVLLALGLALPGAAYADDDTTWAYAGITLDSEALGIGTVYYTSTYFEGEDLVNPTTLVAYTDDEVAAIIAAADTTADAYVEAPADAVLGVSVYGTDTIYWYDAEAAAAIVTYSDALVLDADTGELTISTTSATTVATAGEDEEDTTWAYAGISLDEETLGISTVYYTSNFFDSDLIENLIASGSYTAEELEAIADAADTTADGYIEAPTDAYLGIVTSNGTFWYDYDAAATIVSYSTTMSVSVSGGVNSNTETTTEVVVATALSVDDDDYTTWAYAGITVDGLCTVYYTAAFFDSELTENLMSTGYYDETTLPSIISNADTSTDGYIAAPEGAYLGIAVEGTDTIYWYDYSAAATIVSYSKALSISDSGSVYYTVTSGSSTTVAQAMVDNSDTTKWAYTAITVDGVGTVYYGWGLFYDSALKAYVVASGLYDADTLADIAELYEAESPSYIESPYYAYLGIAVEDTDTIYWYDYDAALAILSYADALDVDADTGTVTYTSTTTTTVATPLEEESADEESSDDTTATDESGATGATGGSGSGAAPGGGSSSGSQGGSQSGSAQGGSQSGSSQGAFAQTGDATSTAVLAVLACGIAALVVALVARRRQSVR